MREKLLRCIGSIGRESKNFKTLHRVWFAVIMLQLQFVIVVLFAKSCNVVPMSVDESY